MVVGYQKSSKFPALYLWNRVKDDKRGERLNTVIGIRIGRGPIGLSCRMYWDVLMVLFLSLLLNYLPIYNFLNSKLLHFSRSQSWFQWTRYLMENYGDRGGCYPSRPYAEGNNTLQDLHNFSYDTKAEFNNCFIIHSK